MTCKLTEKRNVTIMLIAGLVMAVLGGIAGFLLPNEAHAGTRLAGMVAGMGTALAAMGGGVLIWRGVVGEVRAKDSELSMLDERGQAIAYKAQNVMAIAAVAALVTICIVATVRGDLFYMGLAGALAFACAAAKLIALRVYGKQL